MATIGAFHDLSGVGRCSLTAAISILSAMGHHCCPLPTAILSNQTGFSRYTYLDFTEHIPGYLAGWDALDLELDVIYTGFLGSPQQPDLLARYIAQRPGTRVLVDPVIGDNGGLYSCYTAVYVQEMRRLVRQAHVITPNMTELLLLAGHPPERWNSLSREECLACLNDLDAPRLRWAVITGFVEGDRVSNLLVDASSRRVTRTENHYTGVSYSGTGDIFASVLCGHMARGTAMVEAVPAAARFVAEAVAAMDPAADPRHGIRYEKHLHRLTGAPATPT